MQTEMHIYSFCLLEHDLCSMTPRVCPLCMTERLFPAFSIRVTDDWLDKILINTSQLGVQFTSRTYNIKYKYVCMYVYLVLVPLYFFSLGNC